MIEGEFSLLLQNTTKALRYPGKPYQIAWKSVENGKTDVVEARLADGSPIDSAKFRFEGINKNIIPTEIINGIAKLTITGVGDQEAYPIYAVEIGDTIKLAGKLNIVSYDPKPINLVVVPVNGATYPYTQDSLRTKLQAIFNPAIDSLSVTLADNFDTNEFDGELDEISTNLAQSYTREMKDLFQDFEDRNEILDDTYYIFLLPRFAETDQLGYMPRKRKFGFVNHEQLNSKEEEYVKTIAHELSHGAFVLHHTFVQHPQLVDNPTQNLLDNSDDGTILHKYQWDAVHDPSRAWVLFDEDEERANLAILSFIDLSDLPVDQGFTMPDEDDCPKSYFLTEENKLIKLKPDPEISDYYFKEETDFIIAIKKNGKIYKITTPPTTEELPQPTIVNGELVSQKITGLDANYKFVCYSCIAEDISENKSGIERIPTFRNGAITYTFKSVPKEYYINPITQIGCNTNELKFKPGSSNSELVCGQEITSDDCDEIENAIASEVRICSEIPVDEITPLTEDIAVAALKLSTMYNDRILKTEAVRPFGKYHHIGAISGTIPMPTAKKKILDEKLYLLQYHTQEKFFIIFQKIGGQLSRENGAQYARDIIAASSIPEEEKEKTTLLIVPYQTSVSGLSLTTCGIPSISNADLLSDIPYSNISVFDLGVIAFSKFEKPLNVCLVVMLSDATYHRFYQKSETNIVGYPSINRFEIYRSKHDKILRDYRNTKPEKPEEGGIGEYIVYHNKLKTYSDSLKILLENAAIEEALALNGVNNGVFEKEKGKMRLRESYMSDTLLQDQYAMFHIENNNEFISATIKEAIGGYDFNDIEHLHDEVTLHSIVYGTIDGISLVLAPFGLDIFADATGVIYTLAFNSNSTGKLVEYSAALVIPFAIDKAGKGGWNTYKSVRRIESDGSVTYKILDKTEEVRTTDVWITSITATSRANALKIFNKNKEHFEELVNSFYSRVIPDLKNANPNLTPSQLSKISNDIFHNIPLSITNPEIISGNLTKLIAESGDESRELLFSMKKWTDPAKFSKFENDLNNIDFFTHIKTNPKQIKAWKKVSAGGIDDLINQPGYIETLTKVAKYQDEALAGTTGNVKYYRVQTEHPLSKALSVENNNLVFHKPDKALNISTTSRAHADYYAAKKIEQGHTGAQF